MEERSNTAEEGSRSRGAGEEVVGEKIAGGGRDESKRVGKKGGNW